MSDPLAPILADGSAIISTAILFTVLTGIVVAVRIISRPLFGIEYGPEDWFLLAGAAIFWSNSGLQIASIDAARTAKSAYDPGYSKYNKYIYIGGNLYFPAMLFINLSILFLYLRLFTTPGFKKFTLAMMGFTTVWGVVAFFVEVFACWPIAVFWDFTITGKCIYYSTFWLVTGIVELVMDVIFFIMPLYQIIHIQLKSSQKTLLVIVFALGGCSIATGVCRLAQGYISNDSYVNLVKDSLWINIHVGTSILCACLPTMRTLVIKASSTFSSFRSKSGSSGSKSSNSGSGGHNMSSPRTPREKYYKFNYSEENTVEMGNSRAWASPGFNDSREAIRPKHIPGDAV